MPSTQLTTDDGQLTPKCLLFNVLRLLVPSRRVPIRPAASSALFQVFLPAVPWHLPAENLAWFLLKVSGSFALEYEQVKFRE